ncbi:fibronectin type III-like domain-contianing protein [Longibaculum muris]|uniref:fibronectin type III-like domain-contianing protein n=1 Tax=Longibaculum muris TaxID=1796628 RepID=UPI00294388FD|nr:fibronectin type III-like domain-contianing protein [Longibaculum muris]
MFLKPHESQKVEFIITEDMLRFVRKDMKFASEEGDFEIFIGKDCSTENKDTFVLKK